MAGDWIKVRDNIHEDEAVDRIAQALNLDIFAVVGRLVRFWIWVDQNTTDGNAFVTHSFVDRLVSTPGMADAMVLVGWLEVPENGQIRVPKFGRHNGKTAKKRALGRNRQEVFRRNAAVTKPSRTSNANRVTREEKSSSNKHLPVTNSTPTAQPPRTSTPVEEPPRSTPPLEPIARDGFPAEGVAAFANKHGVKVRKPQPASFDEP